MIHRAHQSHRARLFALTLSVPLTNRARADFNTISSRRRITDKVPGMDRRVCVAPADRFAQVNRGFTHVAKMPMQLIVQQAIT
jgi:hypothetical protein